MVSHIFLIREKSCSIVYHLVREKTDATNKRYDNQILRLQVGGAGDQSTEPGPKATQVVIEEPINSNPRSHS